MSILIKGMEMPKNCFDCMFHWHGDGTTYCLAQSKMHDLHHIKWQCKGYEEQMKYREPTCPLVPVPPHGDLIDRVELLVEINKICDRRDAGIISDLTCLQQLLSAVRHAPTIISAEPFNNLSKPCKDDNDIPICTKASPASLGIYKKAEEGE